MADSRVARRYAGALFLSAQKHNVVKSVETDLDSIVALLGNSKFRATFLGKEISLVEKLKLAETLFSDRVTALTMQALRVIFAKGREDELAGIRDEFTNLRREAEGIVFATVSSSEKLTATQEKEILARLRLATGKTIEAQFVVDPSVIGGVKATYGNTVLDGTLRGGLQSLRDKLYRDALKQP